ncbi:MAG: hypothetical protein M3Q97_01630 [Bacteroidota bacterium]|nr:hypothetical protein [Bacteroidota bacterium]
MKVNSGIEDLLNHTIKDTNLEKRGYRPFNDLGNLQQTITAIINNFLSYEGKPGSPNQAPEIDQSSFGWLEFQCTFSLKQAYRYPGNEESYVMLPAQKDIRASLQLQGTLKDLVIFYEDQGATNKIQMSLLTVHLPPLQVYFKNELIMEMTKISLSYGGLINVDEYTLHGDMKAVEALEILARSIIAQFASSQHIRDHPYAGQGLQLPQSSSKKAKLLEAFINTSLIIMMDTSFNKVLELIKPLAPDFDMKAFLGR